LTIYRFSAPTEPQWEEIQSLSLGIIAQGRKAVTAEGKRYAYDQFDYLVLNSRLHFQAQVLEASPDVPFLSFVLQIEPALVREVSAENVGAPRRPSCPAGCIGAVDRKGRRVGAR